MYKNMTQKLFFLNCLSQDLPYCITMNMFPHLTPIYLVKDLLFTNI